MSRLAHRVQLDVVLAAAPGVVGVAQQIVDFVGLVAGQDQFLGGDVFYSLEAAPFPGFDIAHISRHSSGLSSLSKGSPAR